MMKLSNQTMKTERQPVWVCATRKGRGRNINRLIAPTQVGVLFCALLGMHRVEGAVSMKGTITSLSPSPLADDQARDGKPQGMAEIAADERERVKANRSLRARQLLEAGQSVNSVARETGIHVLGVIAIKRADAKDKAWGRHTRRYRRRSGRDLFPEGVKFDNVGPVSSGTEEAVLAVCRAKQLLMGEGPSAA